MMSDAESFPVVGRAYRLGVNPVTTTLVLLGPVVVSLVALLGRTPVTIGIGVAYVFSLPATVGYFWLAETGVGTESGEREETSEGGDE